MKRTTYDKIIIIFIVIIFNIQLSAKDINDITFSSIMEVSKKYNLEPEVTISIIETESNFTPFVICVVLENKKAKETSIRLKNCSIKYTSRNYNGKRIISIKPNNKSNALKALEIVKRSGSLKYDLGIAQVNKMKMIDNGWDEIKMLTDVSYCIDKSAIIIRNCMNIHQDTKKAIECYNKGEHAQYFKYDYYAKVIDNYNKLF